MQEILRHDAHAALALDRLDQDRGGLGCDRGLGRLEIGEGDLVEAARHRAEAFEIFLLAAGSERRQRAAVEGAFEGDDANPFRMTADGVILARHLDRAFHRLRAGIAEEDDVGKARRAQPLRQRLGFRNPVKVRDVPELVSLVGQRLDQLRMRVAEHIDRDARGEIEIALAGRRRQPGTLPPLKSEIGTRIGRQKIGEHGFVSGRRRGDQMKCAAPAGGTSRHFRKRPPPVNRSDW